jgi:hypothetical protein
MRVHKDDLPIVSIDDWKRLAPPKADYQWVQGRSAHELAQAWCRTTTRELGPTRDAVLEAVVQRLDLSQKQAAEAYTLAEAHEPNPRSIWGYAQGLTRLSQRTPWQDGRFVLDRAASRLIATIN